jgi:superfamily II DNA or RNA helicase
MTFDPRADAYVAPGYRYPELRSWAWERGIREGEEAAGGAPGFSSSPTLDSRPGSESEPAFDPRADAELESEPVFFDPRRPRDYQEEALERWDAAGKRGSVVLPTGSGKSFVAIMAMARLMERDPGFSTSDGAPDIDPEAAGPKGVTRSTESTGANAGARGACVVAPTRALLGQWFAQLADAFGAQRVGAFYGDEKDPREITVTTYHSAFSLLERWGRRFQLLVLDEVHHLADNTRGDPRGWHDALRIAPAPFRLGLTATYPDGRDQELQELVGPPAYRRRIGEMVDAELADFAVERRFVALTPSEEEEYRRAHETFEAYMEGHRGEQELDPETLWKRFMAETRTAPRARRAFRAYRERERIVAVARNKLREAGRILRLFPAERAILFCGSAEAAEALSRHFCLPLITAATPTSERKRTLDWVDDGTVRGVVSVRVLDEGWDVPAAKVGIILGDTTRGGRRQHVQRLGRLLRRQGDQMASLFEIVAAGTHEFFASQKRGAGLRKARNRQLGLGL